MSIRAELSSLASLLHVTSNCGRAAKPCRKPLNRRFIVVEGIYANTGDLAPLRELKALKEVRNKAAGRGIQWQRQPPF